MEFADGRIQGFELKFRSLDEDTERYLFALLDLLEEGRIEEVPGQSLYVSHYDGGYAWILDSYFEEGLLGQLDRAEEWMRSAPRPRLRSNCAKER